MLVWSRAGRAWVWALAGVLILVVYAAPMAIIVLASFAGQWNGALPSQLGFANFGAVLDGSPGEALWVSLVTGRRRAWWRW